MKKPLTEEQKVARREYLRAWQAKNREKVRGYVNKYYQGHKEESLERQRQKRAENPERYREYERKYRESGKDAARRGTSEFKERAAQRMRERRASWTPEERRAKYEADRIIRFKRYAAVARLKAERGCLKCGEKDPLVLDFHHRDPKGKEFTVASNIMADWATLEAEMAKCDVVCAHCHRRLHRPKWYDWMLAYDWSGPWPTPS